MLKLISIAGVMQVEQSMQKWDLFLMNLAISAYVVIGSMAAGWRELG